MVAVVRTAGDLLAWHPHVHAIGSRGGWHRQGRWTPVPFVDAVGAERLWASVRWPFYVGLLHAALAGGLVTLYKPAPPPASTAAAPEPRANRPGGTPSGALLD